MRTKRTIAQIREEIEQYRLECKKEKEASQVNPHLVALQQIVADMESGHSNNTTQRLKNLLAEMQDSPLILKVGPRDLKVITTDDYRTNLAHPCGTLLVQDAIVRATDMIAVIQFLLYLLECPNEKAEWYKNWIIEKTSHALTWVLEYLEEHQERERLTPVEAALACLAGDSFARFNERLALQEVVEED